MTSPARSQEQLTGPLQASQNGKSRDQEMSKKVGVEAPPNQLLIFGRGKVGPFLVKEAPLAGIDLPFKALAWQDAQGKVWLSYTTGSYIDKRYAVKGAAEYVKNIDETVAKIMTEALK
jgi:uncharacterized protein (DUF302 family)